MRIWNVYRIGGIEECKKKWTSVRDQLRRTLQKRKTKFGKTVLKNRKYKYENILTFLIPHLAERDLPHDYVPKIKEYEEDDEPESNDHNQDEFPQDSEDPTTENDTAPSGSKNKFAGLKGIKRKTPYFEETSQDDSLSRQLMTYILAEKEAEKKKASRQHPVDAFLAGIAPSLKLLDPYLLNEAKGKIFGVVQEMEMRQIQASESQDQLITKYETFSVPPSESSSSIPYVSPDDGTKSLHHFENL